ncbi:MAG: FtsL-like putative cell division protein [Patescibacteria group bacterium]|jgi:cell division protein FtsL
MSSFKEKKDLLIKMKEGLSLRIINRIIFSIIFMAFGVFLFGANSLSVKGFELGEINKKINDLNAENTELELKIMKLQSYSKINEEVKKLGLVKADAIDYITPSMGVAKR